MALSSPLFATLAGTAADNGTYTLAAGTDPNGNQYYQKGSLYLEYYPGSGQWVLTPSLTGASYPSNTEHYGGPIGDTPTSFSLTGWTKNSAGPATAPAPTFSASAPATMPRNLTVSQVY